METKNMIVNGYTIAPKTDLSKADLFKANLIKADLSEANLFMADLSKANLYKANLSEAKLVSADLYNANLKGANLAGANLKDANLTGANLAGANLTDARLNRTRGNGKEVVNPPIEGPWSITMSQDSIAIGCQQHAPEAWAEFTDDEIADMDTHALEWWKANKKTVLDFYCKHFSPLSA